MKPGSKGIALIRKDKRGRPSLEYVFDVSDTRPVKGAKTPYLWEMREDHHAAVLNALERRYGPTGDGDIGEQIMELAARAVNEVYRDRLTDLAYDVQTSLLEELEKREVGAAVFSNKDHGFAARIEGRDRRRIRARLCAVGGVRRRIERAQKFIP